MSSQHSRLMAQTLNMHAEHFGEQVTYTPPEGSVSTAPITVNHAIVGAEMRERRPGGEKGIELITTLDVTIITDTGSERYSGVSTPLRNATITYNDVEYKVEVVSSSQVTGAQTLKCVRQSTSQRTRPGYFNRS